MHLIFNGLIMICGAGMVVSGWYNGIWLSLLGVLLMLGCVPLSAYLVRHIDPTWITLEKQAAERAAAREAKAYEKQHQWINREKIGFQYFKSTFLFAGYLSQADGAVCEKETTLLDEQFARLHLTHVQIQAAQDYFNQGREPSFDVAAALNDFLTWCKETPVLCESFLHTQFRFVSADGAVSPTELATIEQLAAAMRHYLPPTSNRQAFDDLLAGFRHTATLQAMAKAKAAMDAKKRERDARRAAEAKAKLEAERRKKLSPKQRRLQLAFITLGIKPPVTPVGIKRAYREQIKRNHPDYLLAHGYPETLLAEATAKSADINQAYRLLKKHYGFR